MPGETTERINRHQLVRLLDTMTPHERQAITHRVLIADIDAVAATEAKPAGGQDSRPASQVAAMLPAITVRRRPALTIRLVSTPAHDAVSVASAPLAKPVPTGPTSDETTSSPQQACTAVPVAHPMNIVVGGRPWGSLVFGTLLALALLVLCAVG